MSRKVLKQRTRFGIIALAALLALFGGINIASGASPGSTPNPDGTPDPTPPPFSGAVVNRPAKSELLFVPTNPCRIVDTREGGGILAADSSRNFFITGTSGFVTQGGKSGGCGIPSRAKAVSFSVTSTNTTGDGRITGYPTGSSIPSATTLSYHLGKKDTSSGTVKLGTGGKMTIRNYGYKADIAIDVAGYYIEQIEGMIASDGSVYQGSSRIISAVHNSAGSYTVTVDADATYCTPTVTGYSGYVYASAYGFDGAKIQVYVWYLSGGSEVPYNTYFYLKVDC